MTCAGFNYPYPLGGNPNGRNRYPVATTSSDAIKQSGSTNVGARFPLKSSWPSAQGGSHYITIEDAGIRTGEIIAFRAWDLYGGRLHSVYASHTWEPGCIEVADKITERFGTGIHAFKTLKRCRKEYPYAGAWGEVALWGEVFEHEHGYRAQYASVRKIIGCSFDLPILRPKARFLNRRYRPQAPDCALTQG